MSSYRGNRRAIAGMALLAWIAFSVAISTQPGDLMRGWVMGAGFTGLAIACGVIAWMLTIRLELTNDGLSYRSMFGRREFLWSEVEYTWFSVVSYQIHGIPLGTRRTVTLAERGGRRLMLGNSIARNEAMLREVADLTLPHLHAWMIAALNTGKVLDLGAVRLARISGLEMKGLLGWDTLGLDEIERYEVDGELRVWKRGATFASKVDASRVANVYALETVLDALFKAPVSRDAALFAGFAGPGRRY